jgi:hypothetical protein
VDFVDETDDVVQGIEWEEHYDPILALPNGPKRGAGSSGDESPTPREDPSGVGTPRSPLNVAVTSPLSATATTTATIATSPEFPSRYSLPRAPSWNKAAPPSPLNQVSWPLLDLQEARLFHHFATDVSQFVRILFLFVSVRQTRVDEASQFDFCNREQHFAIEVPQRARSCRTLYNGILALLAQHLS